LNQGDPKLKLFTVSHASHGRLLFKSLVALVLIPLLVTACGKKAPPKPPEAYRPGIIIGLTVFGTPEGMLVGWSHHGPGIGDASFEVLNYELTRKEVLAPESDDEKVIASVMIGETNPNPAVPGNPQYVVLDTTLEHGHKYEYAAYTVNSKGIRSFAETIRVEFNGPFSRLIPQDEPDPWKETEEPF
jgi:hypothetical protein